MTSGEQKTPPHRKGPDGPFLCGLIGCIAALEMSGKLVAMVMLSITFLSLLTNVILRYAFGSGIPWAYEIHAVTLPWLVAGGIVIAAARARNISISLLPDMLNSGPHRVLLLLVHVAVVVIAVSVLTSSQPILRASKFQTLSTLGIKQIWGYSSLIYAFSGTAIIAAINVVRVLIAAPENRDYEQSSLS